MSTSYWDGKEVREIELLDLFPPNDGVISQYYGRIGSGKTYAATRDVLDLLRRGKVVYTNWKLHYEGTDERKSFWWVLISLILPWHKRFYYFPPENLHYLPVDKEFHNNFQKLTDCHVFLDEGHVVFDSYAMARLDIEKRSSILHTRHFDRSIHIISQRPTAIHVAMRANVNVFYKCECLFKFGPIVRFKRTEYQDMLNESVDEDEEKVVSIKYYWGQARVFEAYDTKYLRGNIAASQRVLFKAYDYGYFARVKLLIGTFSKRKYNDVLSPVSTELYPPPALQITDDRASVPVHGFQQEIIQRGDRPQRDVQSYGVREESTTPPSTAKESWWYILLAGDINFWRNILGYGDVGTIRKREGSTGRTTRVGTGF